MVMLTASLLMVRRLACPQKVMPTACPPRVKLTVCLRLAMRMVFPHSGWRWVCLLMDLQKEYPRLGLQKECPQKVMRLAYLPMGWQTDLGLLMVFPQTANWTACPHSDLR